MNATSTATREKQRCFFEKKAEIWDERIRARDHIAIEELFERINFNPSDCILDVGSGTGIMIPYYQKSGISNITAIDSSESMVRIFKQKFPDVKILCQSFLEPRKEHSFADKIIIFNTFPHFEDFNLVFANSARYLRRGGILVITHSMNRRELTECHQRNGSGVANDLLPPDDFFLEKFLEYNFTDISVENASSSFFASGKLI